MCRSLEEINHYHLLIRVRKDEQRDFNAFLKFNGIFQSESQPRIRKRVDIFYYDIFSVDTRFKFWHECSSIYSVINVKDVEGFNDFMKFKDDIKMVSKTVKVMDEKHKKDSLSISESIKKYENITKKWVKCVEPKKSEKKYRPFRTFNEAMKAMDVHGQWIVNKNKDYYLFVHCLNFQNERQMNETFKGYQFLDGTPFGVLEEIK